MSALNRMSSGKFSTLSVEFYLNTLEKLKSKTLNSFLTHRRDKIFELMKKKSKFEREKKDFFRNNKIGELIHMLRVVHKKQTEELMLIIMWCVFNISSVWPIFLM